MNPWVDRNININSPDIFPIFLTYTTPREASDTKVRYSMCFKNISDYACEPERGHLNHLEPFTICPVAKAENPPWMMRPCEPPIIRYIAMGKDCPACIAARPKTPPGLPPGYYSEGKGPLGKI